MGGFHKHLDNLYWDTGLQALGTVPGTRVSWLPPLSQAWRLHSSLVCQARHQVCLDGQSIMTAQRYHDAAKHQVWGRKEARPSGQALAPRGAEGLRALVCAARDGARGSDQSQVPDEEDARS